MNDHTPEVQALIEGTSDTGYQIREVSDRDYGHWILLDASTGEVLDPRWRTLKEILETVARYGRLTSGLSS